MNFKTLRDTEERKILKEIITFFYISNKKILYLFQLILEDNSILKKMFIPLITQYMHFYVYIFLFFFFLPGHASNQHRHVHLIFFHFKRRSRRHSFIPFLTRHHERVDGKLNSFSQHENWMSVVAQSMEHSFPCSTTECPIFR